MKRVAVALVWLALAPAATGCAHPDDASDPVWGKQKCAACAMILSERPPAAELTTNEGERLYFDDPGCLATWMVEHDAATRRAWVRSPEGRWIDARGARYATGERTPMDFGFLAAPTGTSTFDDVVRAARARRREENPK